MSEHLSDLLLDELMLGARPLPPHVDACERCRARLALLRTRATATRASQDFPRRRQQVLARVPPPAPSRSVFSWLRYAAPVAMAMGLATLVWLREPSEGVRVKGGPFVSLVRQRDGAVDAPLRPGDVVTLSLHAAPYRYALVLATDATGGVSPLWPARGDLSGEPAALGVPPTFVVTPGDFTLDAFFSDEPLALSQGQTAVSLAVAACVSRKQPPDCQPPARVAGAVRHHRLSVSVTSDP
ncbi:hypothetical protein [Pyxidicoccus xibeiensis]|uniref:hypothetical protein n=1 Tax=Pyxidicoccus xibeiensis TaxID=2906759 RepID=UPI0020A7E4D9|nr:hypothetical protein [Pyxidicoccus xibeiensis]MCP3137461.1 hypothetical protein [Pyxidicoccus xibeiensis]